MLQIIVKNFKGFKAWSAFGCKAAEKARRNSDHPNTKISHRLRNDECVSFGAKLTFAADEEDDKSIYNHRDDVTSREPKTTLPLNFFLMAVLHSVVLAWEPFCC